MRHARTARGLTQGQVARALEVTPATVSRWERDRAGNVQLRLRPAVAKFLDVSLSELHRLLGLGEPANNVVSMFGASQQEAEQPSNDRLSPSLDEASTAAGLRQRVLGAVAARIATGLPLSDGEVRLHEELIHAARRLDVYE